MSLLIQSKCDQLMNQLTGSNILMFIKAGQRDIRSSNIPHIDIEINKKSTGSQMEPSLWTPPHLGHRGYTVYAVDTFSCR